MAKTRKKAGSVLTMAQHDITPVMSMIGHQLHSVIQNPATGMMLDMELLSKEGRGAGWGPSTDEEQLALVMEKFDIVQGAIALLALVIHSERQMVVDKGIPSDDEEHFVNVSSVDSISTTFQVDYVDETTKKVVRRKVKTADTTLEVAAPVEAGRVPKAPEVPEGHTSGHSGLYL
jgi:hypothetical protein